MFLQQASVQHPNGGPITGSYIKDKQGSPLPPLPGADGGWATRSQNPHAREQGSWTAHPNIHNKQQNVRNRSGSNVVRVTSTQRGQNFKRPPTSDGLARKNANTSYVPGRGQVARPSTTPNPSNRGKVQNHLTIHGTGSPHPEDESQINPEVLMLKDEVRRLQNALLERFRGNSKFVSGGQFRAAQSRQRPDEPDKCMACSSMRVQVKRVKGECRDLRSHCDELDGQLSDAQKTKQRLEMQLQHQQNQHSQAMQQMMGQLQAAREGEASQKAIVDRLRAELEALRNQKHQKPAPQIIESTQDESLRLQRDQLKDQLQLQQNQAAKKVEDLEVELKKLRVYVREVETKYRKSEAQLKEEQAATGMAKTQLRVAEDRVSQLELEKLELEMRLRELQGGSRDHATELEELQAKLKKSEDEKVQLVLKMGKLKGQMGNMEMQKDKAETSAASLEKKLQQLQSEYDKLEREHRARAGQVEEYESQVERLREESDRLRAEVTRLRAEVERLRAELDAAARRRREDAAGAIDASEHSALKQKLAAALKELEAANGEKGKLGEELKALQAELNEMKNKLNRKNDEIAKLEKEKRDIKEKAKNQQKLHAKALETAMQSLVRLCVVAPTVNVHLGEQTLGCKAPLPQKTIRSLVEHQILPNFTSIFLQAEEGAGPGGATLDTWLEGLLAEMQSSIERHLKHVFQSGEGEQ